tara:strand:+ start:352 stop:582 length:231 start_codon:yes stop_codon:yes gene_type:complete
MVQEISVKYPIGTELCWRQYKEKGVITDYKVLSWSTDRKLESYEITWEETGVSAGYHTYFIDLHCDIISQPETEKE